MKIQTRLKLGALIPILLGSLIVIGWMATLRTLDEADRRQETVTGIVKAVFELNILAYEYVQHPSDRPLMQWKSRARSLRELLSSLEPHSAESRRAVHRLRGNSQQASRLFENLASRVEPGGRANGEESRLTDRVISQLLAQSQQMVQDAVSLADEGERNRATVRSRMMWLMILFIVLLSGATLSLAIRTSTKFSESLATLEHGIENISAGNLSHLIAAREKNEFAAIAAAFNDMADRLHRSMTQLQQELRQRREAEEQLRRLNETLEERVVARTALAEQRAVQLRSLASEVTLTEQRERKRIAQILHDNLGQTMVAAKMKCAVLKRFPDPALLKEVALLEEFLTDAIQSSRRLMVDLSPPVLYSVGLEAAISEHIEQLTRTGQLRVSLRAAEETDDYPEDLRVFMFQAVRELLFNVIKHSGTDQAQVEMRKMDGWLSVTVSDKGQGFNMIQLERNPGDHFGLFGIRERSALLGGRLDIDSRPGHGTKATILVPLPG